MTKECLELVLRDWQRGLYAVSLLVLLPIEANPVSKEEQGKKNSDRLRSSSGSKIVFTLLTEVVAVYVRYSEVYVQRTGLQLLLGHLGNDESWSGSRSGSKSGSGSRSSSLQNGFKNLLQVIFGVLGDTSSSKRGVSKRFCPKGSSKLVGQFLT